MIKPFFRLRFFFEKNKPYFVIQNQSYKNKISKSDFKYNLILQFLEQNNIKYCNGFNKKFPSDVLKYFD